MTKESLEEWGERMASVVETDEWADKVVADIESGRAKVITDPVELERIRGLASDELTSGTIIPTFQVDIVSGGPGLTVTRYWSTGTTESHVLFFADATEFKAFLRGLETFGRRSGYLPKRTRKAKSDG